MENLLLFLPFLIPAVVAQFGERQGWARYVTYGLLVALNLTLLGAVALFLTNQLAKVFWPELMNSESMEVHWLALAVTCLLTSMAAFVPLILPVRRWLARWMPIDPNSTVHTTALTFAVYQIGLSLGQLILIGDLENLTEAELALTLWDVLLSGVPFALFALVGVGLFVRRDGQSTLERLGLRRPTWRQLLAATGLIILFLAFDMGVSLLWEELDPAGYDLLERVSENLFGNLTTVGGAIALGLSAGPSPGDDPIRCRPHSVWADAGHPADLCDRSRPGCAAYPERNHNLHPDPRWVQHGGDITRAVAILVSGTRFHGGSSPASTDLWRSAAEMPGVGGRPDPCVP
jgi:hypothetical protein